MAKDYVVIKGQANIIRNETAEGGNTAAEVGGAIYDVADKLEEVDGTLTSAIGTKLPISSVVDNLTSTHTAAPLSANQGKVLNDNKANKTTQVVAGNGLTGGGSLSGDVTVNVGNTDDSIVVGADGIKVDTQNSLTSTSTTKPLSAAQGKALQDNKAEKTRTITAGNGLTGGGDLSADRTINIANADDSLVVAADSVKVNTNNTLTSTSTTQPLSANQGKVLNEKVAQVETNLNYRAYTDNVEGNRFIKEAYLSGSGLNSNKIYYLDLVCRQDSTYKNGFLIKEANPDFSSPAYCISYLNQEESNLQDIIIAYNADNTIKFEMVVDWSVFNVGTNTGEGLRYVFKSNAFDINCNPYIASKKMSDLLDAKIISKLDISNFSESIINVSDMKDSEYTSNSVYSLNGIGIWKTLESNKTFNVLKVKAGMVTANGTLYYKLYTHTSNPKTEIPDATYTLLTSGSVDCPIYNGEFLKINLANTYAVESGKRLILLMSSESSNLIRIARYNGVLSGHNYLLWNGDATMNSFSTTWKTGGAPEYCATPFMECMANDWVTHPELEAKILEEIASTDIVDHGLLGSGKNVINELESGDSTYGGTRIVGTYVQIATPGYFNTVKIKAAAAVANTPVTIKIFRGAASPVYSTNLSSYTEIHSEVQSFDTNVENVKTIKLPNTLLLSAGEYILAVWSSLSSTKVLMKKYGTDIIGRKGMLFGTSTDYANLFSIPLTKADNGSNYSLSEPEISFQAYVSPDVIEKINNDILLLDGRVDQIENPSKEIFCPDIFYAVVGDELNIYYDSIIKGLDAGLRSPLGLYVDISCPTLQTSNAIAVRKERMWQIQSSKLTSSFIGDHTLYINVYNINTVLIASKTCTVRVVSNSGLTTNKNILLIGDSLLNNGPIASTCYNNFVGIGGAIPNFIGKRSYDGVHHEGYPGYAFYTFISNSSYYPYYIFDVPSNTVLYVGDKYSNNSSTFLIEDIRVEGLDGNLRLRCTLSAGTNEPLAAPNTLTFVSGNVGSVTSVIYSAFEKEAGSPFWNTVTNAVDFAYYRNSMGMGTSKFDAVVVMLGVNDSLGGFASSMDNVKDNCKVLINAILADANTYNTKIILQLPPSDANSISSWQVYGDTEFSRKQAYHNNIWLLRKALYTEFTKPEYSGKVYIGQASTGIDRYYGYEYSSVVSSKRVNTINEDYHANCVHPGVPGYQQLGDGFYLQLKALLS